MSSGSKIVVRTKYVPKSHSESSFMDDAPAGSDASGTPLTLASAIHHLAEVDIVLTGMESPDGGTRFVPVHLVERMGLPQLTFASSLEPDPGGSALQASRDRDTRTKFVATDLPALVSMTDRVNEPRPPGLRGIMLAKKKPLNNINAADLGLGAGLLGSSGAVTMVERVTARPASMRCVIIVKEGAAGIQPVDFLKESARSLEKIGSK